MPEGTSHTDSNLIPIGYVRRAHGIHGDVVIRGMVSDAAARFNEGRRLMSDARPSRDYSVLSAKPKGDDFIVHLEGVEDRNNAEALVGTRFVIPLENRRALDPDEWWEEDLVDCTVVDVDGKVLGVVTGVIPGPAQDRIVVNPASGPSFEVPFVEALVPEVRIEARTIVVSLPDGLVGEANEGAG